MKKITTLLLLLVSLQQGFTQTANSVQNGAWLSPSTWDCNCIPVMNYSVTINHNVTLNTSMSFTSSTSGIQINGGGALLQDNGTRDILIAGGKFSMNGGSNANFRYLYIQNSSGGGAGNSGTLTLSAFTNSVLFINGGTIVVDSITNTNHFNNNGTLNADSLTNTSTGTFFNNTTMNVNWSRNYGTMENFGHIKGVAHTNNGNFFNGGTDSLVLSEGLWNTNNFNNESNMRLGGSLYNNDPNTHKAIFYNGGYLDILDSWYNTDTINGNNSGYVIVQDTSANSGYMKGNFYFCDNTPINTNEIVDYNTNSISAQITSCNITGIKKYNNAMGFNFYPNPANQSLTIVCSTNETTQVQITDVLGNWVKQSEINNTQSKIDISDLNSGVYFIRVGNSAQKFVKQ